MKSRLRFSLRTLLLIPVCVGLIFALGQLTRTYGTPDMHAWMKENRNGQHTAYEGPLLFSASKIKFSSNNVAHTERTYYLWLLGAVLEVPLKRHYDDRIGPGNSTIDIMERRMLRR
ncbi:MAG: hypothetical protein R3C09_17225 [Pirellulaceae bacterium]